MTVIQGQILSGGKVTADPIRDYKNHVISRGRAVSRRFELCPGSDMANHLAIAMKKFSVSEPKLSALEKRYYVVVKTEILTEAKKGGGLKVKQGGHAVLNINSLKKRLGISDKEFKEAQNKVNKGTDNQAINKLVKAKTQERIKEQKFLFKQLSDLTNPPIRKKEDALKIHGKTKNLLKDLENESSINSHAKYRQKKLLQTILHHSSSAQNWDELQRRKFRDKFNQFVKFHVGTEIWHDTQLKPKLASLLESKMYVGETQRQQRKRAATRKPYLTRQQAERIVNTNINNLLQNLGNYPLPIVPHEIEHVINHLKENKNFLIKEKKKETLSHLIKDLDNLLDKLTWTNSQTQQFYKKNPPAKKINAYYTNLRLAMNDLRKKFNK